MVMIDDDDDDVDDSDDSCQYLMSVYLVPGTVKSPLPWIISCLIISALRVGCNYYAHFRDENTERLSK